MIVGPHFGGRPKTACFYAAAFFTVLSCFPWYLYFTSFQLSTPIHSLSTQGVLTAREETKVKDPIKIGGQTVSYFDVRYTYSVGGNDYTGTRVDPRDTGAVPVARMMRMGDTTVGRPITVYFNPKDPSDAVLVQINRLDKQYGSIRFPLLLTAIAVSMWIIAFLLPNDHQAESR